MATTASEQAFTNVLRTFISNWDHVEDEIEFKNYDKSGLIADLDYSIREYELLEVYEDAIAFLEGLSEEQVRERIEAMLVEVNQEG